MRDSKVTTAERGVCVDSFVRAPTAAPLIPGEIPGAWTSSDCYQELWQRTKNPHKHSNAARRGSMGALFSSHFLAVVFIVQVIAGALL
jgi:hypothetical protein